MTFSDIPPEKPERISSLMRGLLSGAMNEEHVSVGHILQVFGVRGFAFLLLILSLLNIVIFMLPLISILFGLPMIVLAAQMVLGFRAPIFPPVVRHRTIPRHVLIKGLERAIAGVEKVERYIQPRFLPLSDRYFERIHGGFALIMAIMVAIPIPLFNVPPSIALAMLAIGMLQRDGVFVIFAYAVGAWCLFLFESLGHAMHAWAL